MVAPHRGLHRCPGALPWCLDACFCLWLSRSQTPVLASGQFLSGTWGDDKYKPWLAQRAGGMGGRFSNESVRLKVGVREKSEVTFRCRSIVPQVKQENPEPWQSPAIVRIYHLQVCRARLSWLQCLLLFKSDAYRKSRKQAGALGTRSIWPHGEPVEDGGVILTNIPPPPNRFEWVSWSTEMKYYGAWSSTVLYW